MSAPWWIAGTVWAASVAAGFVGLAHYETTPGVRARSAPDWPAGTRLLRRGPTLVLFAHPECPCTRASLSELQRLLTRTPRAPTTILVFVGPGETLRPIAARVPGVTVVDDADGGETRRFGATTSGHVLLFDADGRRLFHGGITPTRGHEGPSEGHAAVLAHLRGDAAPATAPVFGCPLLEDAP